MPPLPSEFASRHPRTGLRNPFSGPLGAPVAFLASLTIARFAVVGGIGLAVDSAIFRCFTLLDFPDAVARAVSVACATFLTWRLNRALTFGPSDRSQTIESSRYGAVTLAAQGFNYVLFLTLRSRLPDLHDLAALVLSSGAAAGLSFTGHRFFTFTSRHGTPRAETPLIASELAR